LGILTGARSKLQPPVPGFLDSLGEPERNAIADFLALAVIGGPQTVARTFARINELTAVDEFVIVCDIFDPDNRIRALDIAREVWN
jgi:hypothetical protein